MLLVAGRRQYRVIDWLIDWLHNNDVEINWNGQNVNNNIETVTFFVLRLLLFNSLRLEFAKNLNSDHHLQFASEERNRTCLIDSGGWEVLLTL